MLEYETSCANVCSCVFEYVRNHMAIHAHTKYACVRKYIVHRRICCMFFWIKCTGCIDNIKIDLITGLSQQITATLGRVRQRAAPIAWEQSEF